MKRSTSVICSRNLRPGCAARVSVTPIWRRCWSITRAAFCPWTRCTRVRFAYLEPAAIPDLTSRFDLDILLGRDLYPFLDFFLDGRGKHLWRAAGRIDAQLVEAALDVIGGQRLVQLAIEQFDDFPWRT